MKKIILATMAAVACAFGASAQYSSYSSASRLDSIENALADANTRFAEMRADSINKQVWRNGRYFNIGYSQSETGNGKYAVDKSKFAAFLSKGTTYAWPKKGIGGIVKLGLDVRWFDIDFSMFEKFNRDITFNSGSNDGYGWTNDGNSVESDDLPTSIRYDHMQALVGLFGVGPTIVIAPLSHLGGPASSLRITAYAHYQPTFGATLYKGKLMGGKENTNTSYDFDDLAFEAGYVSMMDWGVRLQWKNIGLGMEARWGEGKFKDTHSNASYWSNNSGYASLYINGYGEKYTRKFAETRFYFNLAF